MSVLGIAPRLQPRVAQRVGDECLACIKKRAGGLEQSRTFAAKKKGKKGGPPAPAAAGEQDTGGKSQKAMWVKILDSQTRKINWTEEELAKNFEIGLTFNRESMRRHNLQSADFKMKECLRDEAIRALPPHLQAEARKEDTGVVPLKRRLPLLTPPIPGFDPNDYSDLIVSK